MIECGKCGSPVASTLAQCPNCGESVLNPLDTNHKAVTLPSPKVCSACGAELAHEHPTTDGWYNGLCFPCRQAVRKINSLEVKAPTDASRSSFYTADSAGLLGRTTSKQSAPRSPESASSPAREQRASSETDDDFKRGFLKGLVGVLISWASASPPNRSRGLQPCLCATPV